MNKDNITPGGVPHFSWPVALAAVLIAILAGTWMMLRKPDQPIVALSPSAPKSTQHVTPTPPPLAATEVEASLGELDGELAQMDNDINNIDDLDGF